VARRWRTVIALLLLSGGFAGAAEQPLLDPMRPENFSDPSVLSAQDLHPATKEPDWQFSAVLVSPQRLVAVINGQSVQVGDMLQGYRVQQIERDRAVLVKDKRRVVLQRAATGLKTPTHPSGIDGR
jgi:hypothetical protein